LDNTDAFYNEAFAKWAFSLDIRKILVENTGVFYRRVAKNAYFANTL